MENIKVIHRSGRRRIDIARSELPGLLHDIKKLKDTVTEKPQYGNGTIPKKDYTLRVLALDRIEELLKKQTDTMSLQEIDEYGKELESVYAKWGYLPTVWGVSDESAALYKTIRRLNSRCQEIQFLLKNEVASRRLNISPPIDFRATHEKMVDEIDKSIETQTERVASLKQEIESIDDAELREKLSSLYDNCVVCSTIYPYDRHFSDAELVSQISEYRENLDQMRKGMDYIESKNWKIDNPQHYKTMIRTIGWARNLLSRELSGDPSGVTSDIRNDYAFQSKLAVARNIVSELDSDATTVDEIVNANLALRSLLKKLHTHRLSSEVTGAYSDAYGKSMSAVRTGIEADLEKLDNRIREMTKDDAGLHALESSVSSNLDALEMSVGSRLASKGRGRYYDRVRDPQWFGILHEFAHQYLPNQGTVDRIEYVRRSVLKSRFGIPEEIDINSAATRKSKDDEFHKLVEKIRGMSEADLISEISKMAKEYKTFSEKEDGTSPSIEYHQKVSALNRVVSEIQATSTPKSDEFVTAQLLIDGITANIDQYYGFDDPYFEVMANRNTDVILGGLASFVREAEAYTTKDIDIENLSMAEIVLNLNQILSIQSKGEDPNIRKSKSDEKYADGFYRIQALQDALSSMQGLLQERLEALRQKQTSNSEYSSVVASAYESGLNSRPVSNPHLTVARVPAGPPCNYIGVHQTDTGISVDSHTFSIIPDEVLVLMSDQELTDYRNSLNGGINVATVSDALLAGYGPRGIPSDGIVDEIVQESNIALKSQTFNNFAISAHDAIRRVDDEMKIRETQG